MEGTPGSYLLLLELQRCSLIRVGKLGNFLFPAGWYLYAGSALSGLEQRVAHHLRHSPVRHWHLDYLRSHVDARDVLLFPGPRRRECELAAEILGWQGASVPVPRFGSSDCRCRSHLIHSACRPDLQALRITPTSAGQPHR